MLHVTLSGDIFLKSRRTQPRLVARAVTAMQAAIGDPDLRPRRVGSHRFLVDTDDEAVADRLTRVFGLGSVDSALRVPAGDLEALAEAVARSNAARVDGRTFAIRVRRTGRHAWRSHDLAVRAGDLLRAAGGTVHLDDPEVTVAVRVVDDDAFILTEHRKGAGGLPVGTQGTVLGLVSGGFDSTVAMWMMMSRGAAPEFVHFALSCAQSDHALAVAHALWERWGYGCRPVVHLVEFQPVKDALLDRVDRRMRQVALKVLMARAAEMIARERRIEALVTGDALGQVSSQTLPHLAAVSRAVTIPILRPLVGMDKQQIVDRARLIGTAEISARAAEVCDLSEGGTVATAASPAAVERALARVPERLMVDAVTTRKTFELPDWVPGAVL